MADTYNNKIKIVDLENKSIKTIAGNGIEGYIDDDWNRAQFNEPGGLTILNGIIYVADTNNNLIRIIDLNTKTVSSMVIKGKLKNTGHDVLNIRNYDNVIISYANITEANQIRVNLSPSNKVSLNPNVNSYVNIYDCNGSYISSYFLNSLNSIIPLSHNIQSSCIYINVVIYYCDYEKDGLCYYKDLLFNVLNKSSDDKTISISIN